MTTFLERSDVFGHWGLCRRRYRPHNAAGQETSLQQEGETVRTAVTHPGSVEHLPLTAAAQALLPAVLQALFSGTTVTYAA
jgi:hypothetical protein